MKKPTSAAAAAAPFRVPELADVDEVYAAAQRKMRELVDAQTERMREERTLVEAISKDKAPSMPSKVAELLGDAVSTKAFSRKRLAEVRAQISAINSAIEIQRHRIAEARTPASVKVCDIIRPEYTARVRAMYDAFEALKAARASHDQLLAEGADRDIAMGYLNVMTPYFLGPARDGHIDHWQAEVRKAGYVD